MSFFKRLFGKKKVEKKSTAKPKAEEQVGKSVEKEKATPSAPIDPAKLNPPRSIEAQDQEMQEGIKEMFEQSKSYKALQWMAKNNEIKDEDLVKDSINKLFPRLKRGRIENAKAAVMMIPNKEGEDKEVNIPEELMLAGYDTGPDFYTSFAIDHDQLFTMINNRQLALSGMTKEELLQRACLNFQQQMGPLSKVTQTIFPNVYQLQTDGNSEASAYLFPDIWNTIKSQLKLSNLYLVMPAQNTVLFWESISEETLLDLKQKVSAEIATYPKGSIVSNYLYELKGNAFVSLHQVFEIE